MTFVRAVTAVWDKARKPARGTCPFCILPAFAALTAAAATTVSAGGDPDGGPGPRTQGWYRVGQVTISTHGLPVQPGKTAVLGQIRSSCSCLRVLRYPMALGADRKAEIRIAVRPEKPGPFRHWVAVQLDGENVIRVNVEGKAVDDRAPAGTENALTDLWNLPPAFLRHPYAEHDPKHFVSPREVYDGRREKSIVLIDVRRPDAYASCRIKGSLNMPAYSLKTRRFLRGCAVVLVDWGWMSPSLQEQTNQLRMSDLRSVRILQGGLPAWDHGGFPLEGRLGHAAGLSPVTPADVYRGLRAGAWRVVDVSGEECPAADILFPERTRLETTIPVARISELLAQLYTELDPGQALLLVNRSGYYNGLEGTVGKDTAPLPIFSLTGGWEAMTKYLVRQGRYADRKTVTSSRKGGCAGCP